jgi:FAD synthetase
MMVKVLVFGSFDLLHEGHKHFFNEAKKLGNTLYVVVAKDSSIKSFKGHESNFNEDERVEHIKKLGIVDDVRLGYEGDKWKIIEEIKPDIIALGYDQDSYTKGLENGMRDKNLKVKIVRLSSYMPEKYKSSLMKESID